jgi:hypothetical protein
MITNKLFAIFMLTLLALGFSPIAALANDDFAITDINYEDPVAPGSTASIEVELTNSHSTLDFEDVYVKAWLTDSFGERVTDKAVVGPIQIQQKSEKTLTLKLSIPADLEAGDYNLIVEADGIWEKASQRKTVRAENTIEVEQISDSLYISEIRTSNTKYFAGDNIDVAITVMNNGAEDQDDVSVTALIPELGISKSLKIFGTLFSGNSQIVYMNLPLPKDIDGGIYTLKATVANALTKYTTSTNIVVEEPIKVDTTNVERITIKLGDIDVATSKTFKLQVTNKDSEAKSYELVASGSDWATLAIDPVKFNLRPSQTQTISITLTATKAGQHATSILIAENGKTISAVTIEANAKAKAMPLTTAGLAIVVLAIILAALFVYFQFYRNSDKPAKHIYY